jgi:hypothetical protein
MGSRGVVSMRRFKKEVCNSGPLRVEELVAGIGDSDFCGAVGIGEGAGGMLRSSGRRSQAGDVGPSVRFSSLGERALERILSAEDRGYDPNSSESADISGGGYPIVLELWGYETDGD